MPNRQLSLAMDSRAHRNSGPQSARHKSPKDEETKIWLEDLIVKLDLAEGTFGNLASLAAAKLGGDPGDRLRVRSDQNLQSLVRKAQSFRFHLFDNRARGWWVEVFDHFKVPDDLRKEILAAARNEFYDRIDRSLFEADLSRVIDMLNPRTRESSTKAAARSATTEKLAIAVISFVAKAASRMTPSQKKQSFKGKIPEAPPARNSEPKVKRWKKKPPDEVINRAIAMAKKAVRADGQARDELMQRLTDMGFKIEGNNPPILRVIR